MIKHYLPYSLLVLRLNLLVSLVTTFLIGALNLNGITVDRVIYFFMTSLLSGGFLLGILYFEIARKKEYYFYYNLGITKLKLILITYLFHLIVAIPIIIVAHYAKQI